MATAFHTTAARVPASPMLSLVAQEPTWADSHDVCAIALAINACDAMSAKLATMPMAGNAAYVMGAIGTDLTFSRTSRGRIQVARPTTADSVLGELWTALDSARSRWIQAQLTEAGLGDVWTSAVPASRDDLLRAHEMEGELEASALSVADVVSAARSTGREG